MLLTNATQPLFSILLPTHNRADVLPFAIRSVLAQTIQDFELLVVGDGCTDDTAEAVLSFDDPRIRWFDLPKAPGFGYANRNVALRQARGNLIAFMAHDDLWLPDHLEISVSAFEDIAIEFTYTCPIWIDHHGAVTPYLFDLTEKETLGLFLHQLQNGIPASGIIHRQSCFAKYGYWNDSLPKSGDVDLWIRIIKGGHCRNFVFIHQPTALHFQANWRGRIGGSLELQVWRKLVHNSFFHVSSCLIVESISGVELQATFWKTLSADPVDWVIRLRQAVQITNSSLWWRLLHFVRNLMCRLAPPFTARNRLWLRFARYLKSLF